MRVSLTSLLAFGFTAALPAQSIVYDNTTTSLNNNFPLLPEWEVNSAEAGDEIWLGGTDREVTELKLIFNYRGTVPGTFNALIRFREYDESFQGPGAAFYESPLTQVQTTAGLHELTFAIPNVMVPDHFIWTLQAFDRQGSEGELGMAYFNPPTIGSSEDWLWQRGGNEWTAYSWGGEPYANFGAQLTAVPEPATLLVTAAGLLILRRHRR
ncbi:MAG: PEP-CTERM sorting domain-containing protein [Methanoregulaceae archaeon]|nr:PEP-CTERM sorting domain-containing protein [Methanoregulaceae archaeon]